MKKWEENVANYKGLYARGEALKYKIPWCQQLQSQIDLKLVKGKILYEAEGLLDRNACGMNLRIYQIEESNHFHSQ